MLDDTMDDKLSSTLGALRRKYVASLDERQAQVARAVLQLCDEGFSEEGLAELFYLVHNIVGVAPTYGLPRLGQLATETEMLLSDIRDGGAMGREAEDDLIVAAERLVMEMGRIRRAAA